MYLRNIIESARQFCRAGRKIFPCVYKGKAPITCAEFGFTNGCHSATDDVDKIVAFIEKSGKPCNLGVHAEDVLIVDTDVKYGGGETLVNLVGKHGKLPMTPRARTGSGGNHIWFKKPIHVSIGNWTNKRTGIDTRTNGGFVVAPPSIHECGRPYEWIDNLENPLADCPQWLLDFIIANHPTASKKADKNAPLDLTTFTFTDTEEDLITNVGGDDGERNEVLTRLVGRHLRRGDHYDTIKHIALAWASNCNPPYPESEALAALNSLARKEERKKEEASGENDNADEEELVLSEEAYHGVLGEFVRAVEPYSEADPAAILISALVAVGNVIGNKPYFLVENKKHHGNLFLVCVGVTGNGRKGVSLGRAMGILDDDYEGKNVVNGLSSGEGLINAVRDAVMKFDADTGQYQVVEEGVADKRLLITETEFAQALKVIKREGNTLSPIVRNAFDAMTLSSLTKQQQKATGAHVSIIAHITEKELRKTLSETETVNGFANRFMWIKARRSKYLSEDNNFDGVEPFRVRVRRAIAKAQTFGDMKRSEAAKALWRHLYVEHLNPDHAVLSRAAAITLRLSMLYALLDETDIIEEVHLRAAYAVWRFAESSVHSIFGHDEDHGFEDKVYMAVCGQPGMGRKAIYDHFKRNIPMPKIGDALLRLQAKGKLSASKDTATGGRPAERWHLTPILPNAETSKTSKAPDTLPALGRNDAQVKTPPDPSDVSALRRNDVEPPKPLRLMNQLEAKKELESDEMDDETFMALLKGKAS